MPLLALRKKWQAKASGGAGGQARWRSQLLLGRLLLLLLLLLLVLLAGRRGPGLGRGGAGAGLKYCLRSAPARATPTPPRRRAARAPFVNARAPPSHPPTQMAAPYRLWYSGHSDGSQLAQLAALKAADEVGAERVAGVLLFGPSRVGSRGFAAYYNGLLGAKTAYYAYGRDPASATDYTIADVSAAGCRRGCRAPRWCRPRALAAGARRGRRGPRSRLRRDALC